MIFWSVLSFMAFAQPECTAGPQDQFETRLIADETTPNVLIEVWGQSSRRGKSETLQSLQNTIFLTP